MKAEHRFNKRTSDLFEIENAVVSSGPLASALGIKIRLWAKKPTTANSDSLGLSIHMQPDEALELAHEIYRVTFRYVGGQGGALVSDCPGPLDPVVLEHCWTMYQQGQAATDYSPKQVFGQMLQSLAAWLQGHETSPVALAGVAQEELSGADPVKVISLTKKEVMQMAGYHVHGRESHVGQRYDFTFPGKTGMQNSIFASEQAAAIAMEKQFDADVARARALVNVVSAAGFVPKSED